MSPLDLPQEIEALRPHLQSYLRKHAGWLFRYETVEDLMQGLHLRALERGGSFRDQGRPAFHKWIHTVAASFLSDRRAHWSALKRRSGALLRLTASGTADPGAAAEPAAAGPGPSTFASRREELTIAVRALDALPDRDRDLVRWSAAGTELGEIAGRLALSYDAAKHARHRALDRFRKAFELARRARGPLN